MLVARFVLTLAYPGDKKSFLDWVFVGMFATAYATTFVVAEYYNKEDLFNSMGCGERGRLRMERAEQERAQH